MTAKDLIDFIADYDGGTHVVVALSPGEQLVVSKAGLRLEIEDVRTDRHGVVNIIAASSAGWLDPEIQELERG